MAQVEDGVELQPRAEGSDGIQSDRADEGSGEHAPGERVDANAAGEEDSAEDDAEVVDDGRERLVEEDLAYQQARAQHAAGEEEQLRGQQDAGEVGTQRGGRGVEAAEEEMGVEGSEDLGDYDAQPEH